MITEHTSENNIHRDRVINAYDFVKNSVVMLFKRDKLQRGSLLRSYYGYIDCSEGECFFELDDIYWATCELFPLNYRMLYEVQGVVKRAMRKDLISYGDSLEEVSEINSRIMAIEDHFNTYKKLFS